MDRVRWTTDRAVRFRALVGVIVLCSWVKTLYSHSASLRPGVLMGTDKLLGQPDKNFEGLYVMDYHEMLLISRDDDLREGIPVPHDNCLKSINSFAPCCKKYFYFLLIEVLTSRYSN